MSRLLIFCRETCQTGPLLEPQPNRKSAAVCAATSVKFAFASLRASSNPALLMTRAAIHFMAGWEVPVVKLFRRLPPPNEITDAICEHDIIDSRGPSGTLILQNQPSKQNAATNICRNVRVQRLVLFPLRETTSTLHGHAVWSWLTRADTEMSQSIPSRGMRMRSGELD